MPAAFAPLARNMLDLDPPDHTRLRALVHKAFTPAIVEGMRARIQQLSDELIDRFRGRRAFDLIREYARPIPTTVIAEVLGVPASDRMRFQRWSGAIVAANSPLGIIRALPHVLFFMRYIRRLVEERRRAPREDLLTRLVAAEDSGDRLNADELVAMIFLLLVAGQETTVNLIGNGVLALLENPRQLEALRETPTMIGSAVEELLRFAGPLETATERFAREPVEYGGVTIPAGALVYAVLASANRDNEQFPYPDRLDLKRSPNRHLAFGQGLHYCLGAPLARLETQIAIGNLVAHVPDLRLALAPERLRWKRGLVLRGLRSLSLKGTVSG